jgi:hypothetical protein
VKSWSVVSGALKDMTKPSGSALTRSGGLPAKAAALNVTVGGPVASSLWSVRGAMEALHAGKRPGKAPSN